METTMMVYIGIIGYIWGQYWDNGKEIETTISLGTYS